MRAKKVLLELALIFAMAIATSLTYLLFIVNNSFAPAGISGILTMIQYKSGVNLGLMTLTVNIPLCILALFLTNRDFAVKTMTFCIFDGVSYYLLSKVNLDRFAYSANGTDTVLPVLLAGTVSGIIYGVLFRMNSSTGGVDIIAKIVEKRRVGIGFVWIIFSFNMAVAVISYFVFTETGADGTAVYNFKPVALSVIYNFTASYVASYILDGSKGALRVEVLCDEPSVLAAKIMQYLGRGVTAVSTQGMYSGDERKMLMCIISRHQLNDLLELVREQSGVFLTVSRVSEVHGNFARSLKNK